MPLQIKPSSYKEGRIWFKLFKRASNWSFPARKHFYPIALKLTYRYLLEEWFQERENREIRRKALLRRRALEKKRKKEFKKLRRRLRRIRRKRSKRFFRGVFMLEGKRFYSRDFLRKKLGVGYWNQNRFVDLLHKEVKPIYYWSKRYLFSAYQLKTILYYYNMYKQKKLKALDAIKAIKLRWEDEELFN